MNTTFGEKLRRFGVQTYFEYTQSGHWKTFVAKYHKHGCRACGEPGFVQLHHVSYDRLGREKPSDVIALCPNCHEKVHRILRKCYPNLSLDQQVKHSMHVLGLTQRTKANKKRRHKKKTRSATSRR